jgi:hypothetical protein
MAQSSTTQGVLNWIPHPDTLTHAGTPISESPQDIEFFVGPPVELGRIRTISTTLKRPDHPIPLVLPLLLMAVVMIIFIVLGLLLGSVMGWPMMLFMLLFGGFISLLILGAMSFSHQCSFVGDQGIAYYRLSGSRFKPAVEEKLLFTDVKELRAEVTRQYSSGIHIGTAFNFQFFKHQDTPHRLSGRYHDDQKWSPANDFYFYGRSAEDAWTSYFMSHVNDQLNTFGYVEFATAGHWSQKAIRVGKGFLEFIAKDDSTVHLTVSEIQWAAEKGIFYFEHQDSTQSQGRKRYSFNYFQISNARAFIICLEQLVDIYFD